MDDLWLGLLLVLAAGVAADRGRLWRAERRDRGYLPSRGKDYLYRAPRAGRNYRRGK